MRILRMKIGTHFILIEERCLSQFELVYEVVTALLEYIQKIPKLLQY